MAKILLEVDTSKKTGKVTVDGKTVSDVKHVSYYSADEEFGGFYIEITSKSDSNDLKKIVRLVADTNGNMVDNPDLAARLDMSRALADKWCRNN